MKIRPSHLDDRDSYSGQTFGRNAEPCQAACSRVEIKSGPVSAKLNWKPIRDNLDRLTGTTKQAGKAYLAGELG